MAIWPRARQVPHDGHLSTPARRSSGLLIGPGGEIVAAHADGNQIPAMPEPIIDRIPQAEPEPEPGGGIQATAVVPAKNVAPSAVVATISPAAALPIPSATQGPTSPTPATAALVSSQAESPSPPATPTTGPSTDPSVTAAASTADSTSSSATSTTSVSSNGPSIAQSATTSSVRVSSISSSTIASSTTSSPANTATNAVFAHHPGTHHTLAFWLIISLGAIALAGLLIAFLVWFLRVRRRSIRDTISNNTRWPWDRDDGRLEGGLGKQRRANGDTVQRGSSFHSVLPLPTGIVSREDVLHSSYHIPIGKSPYRMVLTEQQSVPDLVPDTGRLVVANYVPGDSRATSRQDNISERDKDEGPTYCSPDNDVRSWSPLRPRSVQSGYGLGITLDERNSSYPSTDWDEKRQGYHQQPNVGGPNREGWAASLRSNIANAFHAVVGAPSAPAPPRDNLTTAPARIRRLLSSRDGSISEKASLRSKDSFMHKGAGVDHAGTGVDLNSLATWLSQVKHSQEQDENDLQAPPAAFVKSRDRDHLRPLSRQSSVYSTASATTAQRAGTFELPHIPMSRSGSSSSLQQAIQPENIERRMSVKHTPIRPSPLGRMYSNSTASVLSGRSRTSSCASSQLTDEEQFAHNALLERRKRLSNARLHALKQSLRRPTINEDPFADTGQEPGETMVIGQEETA